MSLELPDGMTIEVDDPAVLEDPDVKALLQQTVDSLDSNPLQKYFPHPKQEAFHGARTKIKVFIGGNRSGKSTAGGVDDIIQCVDRDALPDHLLRYKIWEPPFKGRIITPDYGRSFKAVIEVLMMWTPSSQLLGGSWEAAYKDKDKELKFANGSFLEFLTLEQEVNKHGGTARHRVHFDEEPKGDKGEEIRAENVQRLADYRGDELFTFSPVNGLSWTYDELYEERGPEVSSHVYLDDNMVLVQADQDDNPHLSQEGKEEALEKLPEAQREARKSGNYTHWKGLVYPTFDPDIHVIDKDEVDRDLVMTLEQIDGIDPGYNTTAILFGGFDTDSNCLLIYDELFLHNSNALPEPAADSLFNIRETWGLPERPKLTMIDPAAKSPNLVTGERTDQAWLRAGVKFLYGNNDREAGCIDIMRRLDNSDGGEPRPLIRVSSKCKELLREIGKYRLEPKEDGSFDVVKKDDHGCDAMRYMGMARPVVPTRRKKRKQTSQRWVPGTAPAYTPPRRRVGGPMGKFT